MKIIDLLNKIANGEDLPEKIYFFNREFYLKENTYFGDTFTLMHYIREDDLNDEVEITEEEKKIDKYDTGLDNGSWNEESVKKGILEKNNIEDYLVRVMKEVDNVKFKVFEIIDYLQSKGE